MSHRGDLTVNRNKPLLLYLLAAACLAAFLVYKLVPSGESAGLEMRARDASRLMARASAAIRECRLAKGIPIDPVSDPNRTGLIGLKTSPITTSLGSLEAKRTATNPAWAGLVVRLLDQAGARPGDAVAIGASSSFPGLIIAVLAACRASGLTPLVISSLGSSQWGANVPEFNWWDMEDCLNASGVLAVRPIAYSLGGDEDKAADMSLEGRALILGQAARHGASLLEEPDLARTVAARMKLYEQAASGRPIMAFINIGGSWVNLGVDSRVLEVKPGLSMKGGPSEITEFPPPDRTGMIHAWARRGVPVIHFLFVKGLCAAHGLPWDPQPLPAVR